MKIQKSLSAAVLLTIALSLAPPAAADPIGDLWASFLQAVGRAGSAMDPNGNSLDSGPRMDDNGLQAACRDYTACIDPNGLQQSIERQGSACDPNGTTRCIQGDDGPGIDPDGLQGGPDKGMGLDPNGG